MVNYFTFDISKFSGYRLKLEQSNLKYFSKLKLDGFKVTWSGRLNLEYEIDSKLIRKIKLQKLDDSISAYSVEYKLIELLDKSKIREDFSYWPGPGSSGTAGSSSSYSSYWYEGDYYDNDEKSYIKESNKYQSKIHSQMAKQYENKARFRK